MCAKKGKEDEIKCSDPCHGTFISPVTQTQEVQ